MNATGSESSFSKNFKVKSDTGQNIYPVYQSEIESINPHRKNKNQKQIKEEDSKKPQAKNLLVGLALSGGGIRSATFNLGLLQALCCENLIRRIDYLSTVSGGGYIGSCLTSLLNPDIDNPGDLLCIENFPFSNRPPGSSLPVNDPAPPDKQECTAGIEKETVRHLRYYSNYITPTGNFVQKYVRPVIVFLRSLVLNFVTVVPYLIVLAILLAFLFNLRTNFGWDSGFFKWVVFDLNKFETALASVEEKNQAYRVYVLKHTSYLVLTDFEDRVQLLLDPGGTHAKTLTGLKKEQDRAENDFSDELRPVWTGPLTLLALMLLAALVCPLFISEGFKSRFRLSTFLGNILLVSGTIMLVYLYGVLLVYWRHWELPPELGFFSLLSLLAPKLLQAVAGDDEKGKKPWVKITTAVVLLVLVPLTLLFLVGIGIHLLTPDKNLGDTLLFWFRLELPIRYAIFAFAVCLSLGFALLIDVNRISLHNFYRDRLSRAYLVAADGRPRDADKVKQENTQKEQKIPPSITASHLFDKLRHRDVLKLSKLTDRAPYHLINVNLNLTTKLPFTGNLNCLNRIKKCLSKNKNSDPEASHNADPGIFRTGESFIFSKAWCGSEKTGYRKTAAYESRDPHLDLGTAMAISGAAANVGMGLISLPFLRLLMGLLNIRLGYWAPHPKKGTDQESTSTENNGSSKAISDGDRAKLHPIYNFRKIWCSIYEWFFGYKLEAKYISLSDGGHFENLGVYELLRRRCKYIIVGDAEADRQMSFNSLSNIIRLARIDFGIIIDIDISDIKPDPQTGISRNHCAVGVINYPAVDDDLKEETGYLLYCKSSLTGDEPQHLNEYRVHHPAFPHESTADQWFDERQFEVYRELGYHIGRETFASCPLIVEEDPRPLEEVFADLKRCWHPHCLAAETHFSKHGKELNNIISQIKNDPDLAFMDAQVYPEWQSLVQLPYRSVEPPNLWIPHDPAAIRKGFYVCQLMVQLMENVYLDLDLEHTYEHPEFAGWMNLFMHWSGAGMFRVTWAICACTFGEKFQSFCRNKLKLKVSEVVIEDISKHFESEFDKTNKETEQLQLTTASKKELGQWLNPIEIRKIDAYLNALNIEAERPPEKCYALRLEVKDKIHKAHSKIFGFGFVLVTREDSNFRIHYLRIQDHLRKMGLGRLALKTLLNVWVKPELHDDTRLDNVTMVDEHALMQGDFQKELAPYRSIFEEILDSVKTSKKTELGLER